MFSSNRVDLSLSSSVNCNRSIMQRLIWMTLLCLPTILCNQPCKKKKSHLRKTGVFGQSQQLLGRLIFLVRLFETHNDFFQLHLQSPSSNPLSIQIPLWSGRLQPECYWLRAYNVSLPPVLVLSSSPDVHLLLVMKRQALDQHKEPFQ